MGRSKGTTDSEVVSASAKVQRKLFSKNMEAGEK